VDIPDTNIILGVQWLSTLGPITTDYKTMEMSFNTEEGKSITLKAMIGGAPRFVVAKRMHAIFRREEVSYGAECFVIEWIVDNTSNTFQIYKKSFSSIKRSLNRFHQVNH
jgi:hypothetical protein